MSKPCEIDNTQREAQIPCASSRLAEESVCTGQAPVRDNRMNSNSRDSLPPVELVDMGGARAVQANNMSYSAMRSGEGAHGGMIDRDRAEASRLMRVLNGTGLREELDAAKNGKFDGKISKHDLDIYLRMHQEDSVQTRAAREMREAWDDKHNPNYRAVHIVKDEMKQERNDVRDHQVRVPLPLPRIEFHNRRQEQQYTGSEEQPHMGRRLPEGPQQRPEVDPRCVVEPPVRRPEVDPRCVVEPSSDLSARLAEAGKVRAGEGYYQVAQRMLETMGAKSSPQETMALTRELMTANENRTVLTTRDNLADLLPRTRYGANQRRSR